MPNRTITSQTRAYRRYRLTAVLISGDWDGIVYDPDGSIIDSEITGASASEVMIKAMRVVDAAILKGQ